MPSAAERTNLCFCRDSVVVRYTALHRGMSFCLRPYSCKILRDVLHNSYVCEDIYLFLTFVGPCIVIYFCSETNKMHNISEFILFWNNTLLVSDCLFVHHQEFKAAHTASGICHKGLVAAC
jgi:hypothetical protein